VAATKVEDSAVPRCQLSTVRFYSDGPEDSMSRSLALYSQKMAAIYMPSYQVRLIAREDRFGRGSDHSSFTARGYPAVVFREANENFAMQHSSNDTFEGVDFKYLARNARVNAGGVASWRLRRRRQRWSTIAVNR
jgi:Zn-dependent M28 family amino/carboxypeptidase